LGGVLLAEGLEYLKKRNDSNWFFVVVHHIDAMDPVHYQLVEELAEVGLWRDSDRTHSIWSSEFDEFVCRYEKPGHQPSVVADDLEVRCADVPNKLALGVHHTHSTHPARMNATKGINCEFVIPDSDYFPVS